MDCRLLAIAAIAVLGTGCLDFLGGGSSSTSLVVNMRFDEDAHGMEIQSDGNLPEDLRVEISGGGAQETVVAGSISGLGTPRATFESPLALQDDTVYDVRVIQDGAVLVERTFRFYDKDFFEPQGNVRATYDVSMGESDATFEMAVSGSGVVEQTGDTLRVDIQGQGSMNMEDEGFSMDLVIHEIRFTDIDDRMTDGFMSATGTWTADDDGFSGEGTVDRLETHLLGPESHVDGQGQVQDADKERFEMMMSGTFTSDGTDGEIESETDETTWSHPEDGIEFWREGYEETTFTVDGETFSDRNDFDEAVDEDEAEASLSDMLPDEGPSVWPLMAGDSFVHEGTDVRVEFQVRNGGAMTVAGQSVATWVIQGTALSGAQGGEEVVIVSEGSFAGLPLHFEEDYTRGELATSMTLNLQSVD